MKKFDFKKIGIKAAGAGAGALASTFVNKVPFIADLNPGIRGLVKVGIGAFLPTLMKGEFMEATGMGFMAAGTVESAQAWIPGLAGITMGSIGEAAYIEEDYLPEEVSGAYDEAIYGTEEVPAA